MLVMNLKNICLCKWSQTVTKPPHQDLSSSSLVGVNVVGWPVPVRLAAVQTPETEPLWLWGDEALQNR